MKILIALCVLTAAVVGCSAKQDVGDANVQVAPGTAKMPGAAGPNAGGGGGAKPTGPTSPGAAGPMTPGAPK